MANNARKAVVNLGQSTESDNVWNGYDTSVLAPRTSRESHPLNVHIPGFGTVRVFTVDEIVELIDVLADRAAA